MKKFPLHWMILAGMLAGVLFGHFLPQYVFLAKPFGEIFLRLLKMMVVPLIFFSIVDGVTRVGSAQKLSELGLKTTAFYLTTNALAVLTSLILVNWIRPGNGVKIFGEHREAAVATFSWMSLVPQNIFEAFVSGDTLQIIFVALFFGVGLVAIKDQVPRLVAWFREANDVSLKLTGFIINLAPLGVFGLLAGMVQAFDWQALAGIGKFAATLLIGLLIHGMITLPIFFKLFSNRPLLPFVKQMEPALLTSFSTSSSSATLPVTIECIEEKAKIPKEIAGFVLPIGATVNMDGTAIYEAAACLFVAQAIGVHLDLSQQLIVFFTAALAAIGAAAIPSAGLVTLAMVLNAVHLPLEGIGFLLAIDRPLDMSRTVVNVWGDMVACVVIEGKKKK